VKGQHEECGVQAAVWNTNGVTEAHATQVGSIVHTIASLLTSTKTAF
jgi:hypothetical protein